MAQPLLTVTLPNGATMEAWETKNNMNPPGHCWEVSIVYEDGEFDIIGTTDTLWLTRL